MTRAHDALSLALVDHLDLGGAPPVYMRLAEMLRPLAAAVVTEAFDEALAKATNDKEALDLFRERMAKLYTCRLTEWAFYPARATPASSTERLTRLPAPPP